MSQRTKPLIAVFAAVLLFGGCRTYGGYESEELTAAQAANLVEGEERAMSDARLFLERMRSAGIADVSPFESVVEAQQELIDRHKEKAAELAQSGDYRQLNRAYGAMITERHAVRIAYSEALLEMAETIGHPDSESLSSREAMYIVFPVAYRKGAMARLDSDTMSFRSNAG